MRRIAILIVTLVPFLAPAPALAGGVFVRLRLVEPKQASYYVRLGGYIHVVPWYLPKATLPAGADKNRDARLATGQWTGWFDLKAHAGKRLHGRLHRSGGVAEFPNVTVELPGLDATAPKRVQIELATAADLARVVKRFDERFTGRRTSFLVSPDLAKDAADLESLSQMQARHLAWARQATGGKRVSPKHHILQTSFWGPTLEGAAVLSLLGFNVVGNQSEAVHEAFPHLRRPGHSHGVAFGPAATREQIDALMAKHAQRYDGRFDPGTVFGFADEICARPRIGRDEKALAHFRAWLAERKLDAKSLGAESLERVLPIETPDELKLRARSGQAAANRVFYYTSRFRQLAGTERIRWHTEAYRKHFRTKAYTSTLVADHPYFGGTGLGMGIQPNTTWGGHPLALDWFDLARRKAVDLIGIEDWMGLQYMYGPNSTWEGFQLMGFQASIMRSGGRGRVPIIAWITPSDETNLRLKSASALCQGAKHFFYWTYGPTCFSTENYWSDLKSEYDGVAKIARQLAAAEHIVAPGKHRKTRVGLLYSISSDLWQPFGYVHMLERRATYLALVHGQHLVDMLTEEDVDAGRLREYDVLYATDPCIKTTAAERIVEWVRAGGVLYGTCAAGSRNEFNEPAEGLSKAFGIAPDVKATVRKGEYRIRGRLNGITYVDEIRLAKAKIGVIGAKVAFRPAGAEVVGTFSDGKTPAAAAHVLGKGSSFYVAACPGISYLKDARFVPRELKERYPEPQRNLVLSVARAAKVDPPVELSHPVVEAGVYDAPKGTALVLANFTYDPIAQLKVRLPVRRAVKTVRSVENGTLKFETSPPSPAQRKQGFAHTISFTTRLGINDIIVLE